MQETVDDRLRILRLGEHTVVFLDGQSYAMPFEPLVGIALTEPFHEALHQPVTTGIHLFQVTYILEGIRAVAPSAPGYCHLAQHLTAALEDGDVHLRHHLLQADGQEESCRTPSYNRCSCHIWGEVTKKCCIFQVLCQYHCDYR